MINWKDPAKELPKEDQLVWVLEKHEKRDSEMNCEIWCGVVCEATGGIVYVENQDELGQGNRTVHLVCKNYPCWWSHATAWADLDEISYPKFLPYMAFK